jgi:hypothetical protein
MPSNRGPQQAARAADPCDGNGERGVLPAITNEVKVTLFTLAPLAWLTHCRSPLIGPVVWCCTMKPKVPILPGIVMALPLVTLGALAGYAHRQYAIEQFHEKAKGELGWDQDHGWLWSGFHRHAVTVILACSFLVWMEGRQRHGRHGRPRNPFSPSASSGPADLAGGPS